ncbi:transposase [Frigidibacter sp. MR17.14]|uniref:transposase n=1 Tax=Frigidibacter sp. MR17.14 TaxID=3126509 RepID=UPI003FA5C0A5
MDAVVPWALLSALIEPHYPKAGPKGGRQPIALEVMLRIYWLRQWYALSDLAAEEALCDSEAMRRFAGLELGDDAIPDETTIPKLPAPAGAASADAGDLRGGERLLAREVHPAA